MFNGLLKLTERRKKLDTVYMIIFLYIICIYWQQADGSTTAVKELTCRDSIFFFFFFNHFHANLISIKISTHDSSSPYASGRPFSATVEDFLLFLFRPSPEWKKVWKTKKKKNERQIGKLMDRINFLDSIFNYSFSKPTEEHHYTKEMCLKRGKKQYDW